MEVDLATAIDQVAKKHDESIVRVSRAIHGGIRITDEPGHSHAFAAAGTRGGDRVATDAARSLAYAAPRALGAS